VESLSGCSSRMHNGVAPRLRHGVVLRAQQDPIGKGPSSKSKLGENLDDRILSGEFSDTGSTKEQLTRPIRKALAEDPVGIGTA
jgi:hypothetical protein